ncbi:MAG: polysaccharide export protein [Verrucomicrobiaceae bacterium]|nr:polysaccharide export protein [Verrucomicrobiaceae bacterium]MDB6119939.1 polysaccharide export protein [Verrucomicrobiaceae bacterium]
MRTLLITLAALFTMMSGLQAQNRELALQSGDKIGLTVGGIPPEDAQSINHIYPVGEDGSISIQFLDRVTAAGVKPSDLARKIESLFKSKEIYTHPSVTVSVDAQGGTERLVYASGEVTKPGPVPYRSGMTVSKVITSAGGPTAFGRMKSVKLKRNGRLIRELNLSKASSTDGDVLVEPEDEIVVPN